MLKGRLFLLFTACIWGVAFVFQRMATDTIGPFGFNAARYLLATLTLLPICVFGKDTTPMKKAPFSIWIAGAIVGIFMTIGAALQQIGIEHTSAGKTAFITALYIVIVPILGLFLGYRLSILAILGVFATLFGIGLMTITSSFSILPSDCIIISSTLFWACQILAMSYFSPRYPCIRLTAIQFLYTTLFNGIYVLCFEPLTWTMIQHSLIPIFYGGCISLAGGFSIQTIFQRIVPPTEVALILSTEMVFGALAGALLLGEMMTTRDIIGVLFICIGVVCAQLPLPLKYTIAPIYLFKKSTSPSDLPMEGSQN